MPHLGEHVIEQLRLLQAAFAEDTDLSHVLALDREFHMLGYSGCTSENLLATVERFWNSAQHLLRTFMEVSGPSRRWVVNSGHDLIIDAIEMRATHDAERYLAVTTGAPARN